MTLSLKKPVTAKINRRDIPRTPVKIHIRNNTAEPVSVAYLRAHLKSAHAALKSPVIDLSIALVGDKTMSKLHLQFMNIPGPTDVLTFPLQEDARGAAVAGEVVVCVSEARRHCRNNGGKLREELLLYALHGLLHLSGFDDRTEPDFKRMHRKEDEILSQLGIGRVFDRR